MDPDFGRELLLRVDKFPDTSSQCTASQRAEDKDPNLLQGSTTLKECGTDATGRVHGSSSVVDANQMDQHESQTNGQTGERSRGQVIDLFTKKSKTCPSDLSISSKDRKYL